MRNIVIMVSPCTGKVVGMTGIFAVCATSMTTAHTLVTHQHHTLVNINIIHIISDKIFKVSISYHSNFNHEE